MKSKKLFILMIALAVSTIFTGCNAINGAFDSLFLATPEVKAADLADFSGTTPTTDEDVLYGFMTGMEMAMSPAASMMPRALGADYAEVERVLELTIPGFAESRTVDVESRKVTFGVNASVSDEVIASDYDAGDSFDDGKLTITVAEVKADLKADSIDPSKMTEAEAEFSAKLELIMEGVTDYDYNYSTYEYDIVAAEINEINFNVNAKGNVKATIGTNGPEQMDFYAAADVSIGFSLTSSDPNLSGKYIFNFNYVQSATVTESDINNGEFTGDAEEVTITIEVYKNDDTIARKVTYTQTELTNLMVGM